jgi:hypothetical protein
MIISGSSQFTNYSNSGSSHSRAATYEQKNDQNKSAQKSPEQTNNTQSSDSQTQSVFDSTSTSELIPLLQSPKQLDNGVDRQAMSYYSKSSISLYENNQNPAQSAGSARMVIDENGRAAQISGIDTMV